MAEDTIRGFGDADNAMDVDDTAPAPASNGTFRTGRYIPSYDDDWFWWWWINAYNELKKEEEELKLEVDLLKTANRMEHYTENYGVSNLVVRRGQPLSLKVKVNREFNEAKDRLNLIFSTGPRPQASKGTLSRVNIVKEQLDFSKESSLDWVGCIKSVKIADGESEVTVTVRPAANCPVGKYKLMVKYFREVDGQEKRFSKKLETEEEEIYILFNAWCQDDQVYLESAEERKEYVLNESGRIFVGSGYFPSSRPWNFGQFSQWSIKAAFVCLEKSDLDSRAHGNATKVCRALSSMVNMCGDDDKGILVGNWTGKYEGGTSPTMWTGSPAILEQFVTNERAVKYGQCWVFSGITTTLGRALGIPTRTVTNFDSAHDHDESLTIDKHFTEDGEPLTKLDDSVWNFHVWNESWMTRHDLPEGYGGWQAYDATPQELSEGQMQCGPASVKCIKEGNVYLNHDAKFIYAEVNGDELKWTVDKDNKYTLREVVEFSNVGSRTSTKAVGSNERNDITYDYKHWSGTPKAKEARERALGYSNTKKIEELKKEFKHIEGDVAFEYDSSIESNGDIKVDLKATNNSTSERNIRLRASSHSTYYTSIPAERLSNEVIEYKVDPGQTTTKTWSLTAAQYWSKVDEDAMLKLFLMARVKETDQTFTKSEPFSLQKQELHMQVSNDKPKVGQEVTLTISFYNPLAQDLKESSFTIEGPGILKQRIIKLDRTITPFELVEHKVTLTPKYKGEREIVAVFHSKQLVNLVGAVMVDVQASE